MSREIMPAPHGQVMEIENLGIHLATRRGKVRLVDKVSLSVAKGRTLAIVGESGAGKSMLCRAVTGILPPRAELTGDTGIWLDGHDLTRIPRSEAYLRRGRGIGVILQNPLSALNPVLTIGRQIMEPMAYHLKITGTRARRRAVDLLDSVGIPRPEERIGCYPHQLSGGMCQRVAIAMALACDPTLLIADEPTSALDVTVQAEILTLLANLQRERQLAMILVTHDMGVVASRAHETAVMYAGRIVEQAPTCTLFTSMRMHYTRALFEAIPRIDATSTAPLRGIDGQPPDPAAAAAGCPFAPRCPRAEEQCRREEPPLITTEDDPHHRYACWFPCTPGAAP